MDMFYKTRKFNKMPLEQLGYWNKRGEILVAECEDWRYEACIAVHEAIEYILCKYRGISSDEIDKWDKEHEEGGDNRDAPYYLEHSFANRIERKIVEELGINFKEYEQYLDNL